MSNWVTIVVGPPVKWSTGGPTTIVSIIDEKSDKKIKVVKSLDSLFLGLSYCKFCMPADYNSFNSRMKSITNIIVSTLVQRTTLWDREHKGVPESQQTLVQIILLQNQNLLFIQNLFWYGRSLSIFSSTAIMGH